MQPANHIEVQVGGNVRKRQWWMLGEPGGADQSNFFASPGSEDNAARESFGMFRAFSRQGRGKNGVALAEPESPRPTAVRTMP